MACADLVFTRLQTDRVVAFCCRSGEGHRHDDCAVCSVEDLVSSKDVSDLTSRLKVDVRGDRVGIASLCCGDCTDLGGIEGEFETANLGSVVLDGPLNGDFLTGSSLDDVVLAVEGVVLTGRNQIVHNLVTGRLRRGSSCRFDTLANADGQTVEGVCVHGAFFVACADLVFTGLQTDRVIAFCCRSGEGHRHDDCAVCSVEDLVSCKDVSDLTGRLKVDVRVDRVGIASLCSGDSTDLGGIEGEFETADLGCVIVDNPLDGDFFACGCLDDIILAVERVVLSGRNEVIDDAVAGRSRIGLRGFVCCVSDLQGDTVEGIIPCRALLVTGCDLVFTGLQTDRVAALHSRSGNI